MKKKENNDQDRSEGLRKRFNKDQKLDGGLQSQDIQSIVQEVKSLKF